MSKGMMDPGPPLVEFLNTLPSPLTTALVGLAPYTSWLRHLALVFSWKSSWEDSWIALFAWWAVCLLADVSLRYILPVAMLVILLFIRWTHKAVVPPPPITEDTLQRAIADLTTIHSLLPNFPSPSSSLPPGVLLRVCAISYIPYLILTHIVRLRVVLAISGTILLTWRARWTGLIRRTLWRSAFLRWGVYRTWAFLSGQRLPPQTHSIQSAAVSAGPPSPSSASTSPVQPGHFLRFLFTVYENQRWWMGLDWTAALLPGERPSWCSAAQQPVAPPSAFALPAATTRTARWRWEEAEWRVMVRREGGGVSRVERPLPKEKDDAGPAASAILRAAGKMREGSISKSPERPREKEREEHVSDDGEGVDDEAEPVTDADGWIYADNKWEGGSSKGNMGKYTRYRRWTRIAVLSETIEPVEAGEVGIRRDDSDTASTTTAAESVRSESVSSKDGQNGKALGSQEDEESDQSRLRRRLRAAVRSATLT
ncbi:integral peroxisomal membrane peroxin-domain-containing protein [Amylocystis lapponica]|nr:integral peroxisomal membrane peroxin-domain-containing protein [Amylocystis lapponica]